MAIPGDPVGHASQLLQQGRVSEAREVLRPLLAAIRPDPEALHLAGMVEMLGGSPQAAIPLLSRAVELAPNVAFAWSNLGVAFNAASDFTNALRCFQRTLELLPGNATALKNHGIALRYLGRHEEAMTSFRRAAQRAPEDAELNREVGDLLVDMGRLPDALARYDRALAANPRDAATHHNRGFAAWRQGHLERAVQDYRRALEIAPQFARAHSSLGVALNDLGHHAEAAAAHARALEIEPRNAQFHNNFGIALDDLGRGDEAIAAFDRALALDPRYADAWANRAAALNDLRRYAEALADYERAHELAPAMAHLPGHRLHIQMQLCDWRDFEGLVAQIRDGLAAGQPAAQPFALLSVDADPALHRTCSELYARDILRRVPSQKWTSSPCSHERIRVGYFSADMHDHPVAYLLAALVERHDRARFEVSGFSYGPPAQDATRKRLQGAFERFEDVRAHSDAQIAALSRRLGIDIAVDLMGYTQGARTAIFAHRAAPVQAQYLGYPGTMGTECIDYLIADATVVPGEHPAHYREKIVFLPDSYQVNDAGREVATTAPTRAQLGLPETGFVFCCFNNKAKVTPGVFDIWMRLLAQVPESVLWLVQTDTLASDNLRSEAARRGVDARRLVFAPRVPIAQHLARAGAADLFLDTLNYNGHATTSDTLLAGVPVVTCLGNAFPGRVSASLLGAIGMPELAVRTPAEYEALALRLATDPEALRALRAKLARNRATEPLFDAARFARHLETAYSKMVERQRAGLPPDHLRL